MPLNIPDLVAVGHVCRDVVPHSSGWRIGGSVFYIASAASRLGCSVGVLTSGGPEVQALRAIPGCTVISLDARESTSFENRNEAGLRRQRLLARAPSIPRDLLPAEWTRCPVALLAPVAGEVPLVMARAFPQALTAVLPQGWMRRWDVAGEVRSAPWERAAEVLANVTAAIFSEEDLGRSTPSWLGFRGPLLVLTRAAKGCSVLYRNLRRDVPGFPVQEVDPTGAGDVFAAAFMLSLRESRDPLAAARFANCAASFAVQASGAERFASTDQVDERIGSVQKRLPEDAPARP